MMLLGWSMITIMIPSYLKDLGLKWLPLSHSSLDWCFSRVRQSSIEQIARYNCSKPYLLGCHHIYYHFCIYKVHSFYLVFIMNDNLNSYDNSRKILYHCLNLVLIEINSSPDNSFQFFKECRHPYKQPLFLDLLSMQSSHSTCHSNMPLPRLHSHNSTLMRSQLALGVLYSLFHSVRSLLDIHWSVEWAYQRVTVWNFWTLLWFCQGRVPQAMRIRLS